MLKGKEKTEGHRSGFAPIWSRVDEFKHRATSTHVIASPLFREESPDIQGSLLAWGILHK